MCSTIYMRRNEKREYFAYILRSVFPSMARTDLIHPDCVVVICWLRAGMSHSGNRPLPHLLLSTVTQTVHGSLASVKQQCNSRRWASHFLRPGRLPREVWEGGISHTTYLQAVDGNWKYAGLCQMAHSGFYGCQCRPLETPGTIKRCIFEIVCFATGAPFERCRPPPAKCPRKSSCPYHFFKRGYAHSCI